MIGLTGAVNTPRAEFRDEEISMELLPVEVAFNSLSKAISQLSNITDELESRLSPLLFLCLMQKIKPIQEMRWRMSLNYRVICI
jgi:hypothetical protein